jgi:hypothetical protein
LLQAAGEMIPNRLVDRSPTVVDAPRVGVLLLVVLLAHLLFMASPFHMAMVGTDQAHQTVRPGGGLESAQVQIAVGEKPHLDCAIQWVSSPHSSPLLLVFAAGALLGWMNGRSTSTLARRPHAHANGPPMAGDRQALLQVFRI